MNHSLFMALSSQVRVADLLTPLQVSLPADLGLAEAGDRVKGLGLQDGRYSLVTDGDDTVGWIDGNRLGLIDILPANADANATVGTLRIGWTHVGSLLRTRRPVARCNSSPLSTRLSRGSSSTATSSSERWTTTASSSRRSRSACSRS
jgi:hypothetical protein